MVFIDLAKAFVIGGAICVIGQLLLDIGKLTPAHVMCVLVSIGSILGALGLYPLLVDFAGFGAALPIVSFGNSLVQGAMALANEKGFWGIWQGLFHDISAGISAAIIFGFLTALIFKPQSK